MINFLFNIFNFLTWDIFEDNDLEYNQLHNEINIFFNNWVAIDPIQLDPINQRKNEADARFQESLANLLSSAEIHSEVWNELNDSVLQSSQDIWKESIKNIERLAENDLDYFFRLEAKNALRCVDESNSLLLWEVTNNLQNLNLIMERLPIVRKKNLFLSEFNNLWGDSVLKNKWSTAQVPLKLNSYVLWQDVWLQDKDKHQVRLDQLEEVQKHCLKAVTQSLKKKW